MKKILIILFFISLNCFGQSPYITGVLINACNGLCQEGDNEIIFLNSGGHSISCTAGNVVANVNISYGSTIGTVNNITGVFSNNGALNTYITTLNTTAGCPGLFVKAYGSIIPANTSFMIMRNTACYPYNFSSFCGLGPVYVLFSNDANWIQGGCFLNSGAGLTRYFISDFTNLSSCGTCVINYSYKPSLLSLQTDGDAIGFPGTGGAAIKYFNNGCNPDNDVLPIELLDFSGQQEGDYNLLKWITASETNNNYFTIERSVDANNFFQVGTIPGAGNSISTLSYSMEDTKPYDGVTYYRLSQTDYNGESKTFKIISVSRMSTGKYLKVIKMTNLLGQEVSEDYLGVIIYYFSDGSAVKKYNIK